MTKVRRLSDGRIFSSPRGVAMEAGKPIAKAVYYCCRGYILAVEGEKYEWVYDEGEDRGKRDHSERSYWERREKWIRRTWVTKWRAKFIEAWLKSVGNSDRWYTAGEIAQGIGAVAESVDEQYKWTPTAPNLSRHLHTYQELYDLAFGMQERMADNPVYKGRMFKFTATEINAEYDVLLQGLADSEEWFKGKPVIRINDGKRFRSMAEAERVTGVPYYRIHHCCEGDIPYYEVPLTGEKLEFRYATEVDGE